MPLKKNKFINKMKRNSIITISIISSFLVAFAIIIFGMTFYKYKISKIITNPEESNIYKYHYAMISDEADDPFWDSVYQSALEKGKEQDVYVEKLGSNLSITYSLYDLMEIAIASKVDGIIIEPNGDERIIKLIDKAESEGITVITVLNDVAVSQRKSFVGISSYSLGQAYGEQVREVVKAGKSKITVILNEESKGTNQNSIYSSICETIDKEKVKVESTTVHAQNTFSSEEVIRNLIMDTENPPDVLVCLNADDTVCAYQAIVDYNKVGEIDVIGYYDSDLILSAIEKNIIHSTMSINAKQMGAYCVEALTEYIETKHVSNYFTVDISIITADNVQKYINARNNQTRKEE